jgi:hypothetical protein
VLQNKSLRATDATLPGADSSTNPTLAELLRLTLNEH